MKRILCLWFPHWPLQRAVVCRKAAEADAVVLLRRDARQTERVVACSRAAWGRGVRLGMPRAEVESLAAAGFTADGWLLLAHDPAGDRETLLGLAAECERFSPLVGLEQADEPASLLLDVTGIGPLFGGEAKLLNAASGWLAERGYRPRAGLAGSVGAAWAAAHFGGPAAIAVEQAGVVPASCREMPLAALRISPSATAVLEELGLSRIGQLLAIERTALAERFGGELMQRLDQLQGVLAEPLVPHRPSPAVETEVILEHPARSLVVVEHWLERLVGELAEQLRRRGHGAVQLVCRLDCEGGPPLLLRAGLYRPSSAREHLAELLRLPLAQARPSGAVGRIGLAATLTAALVEEQTELFASARDRARNETVRLIDRLASRLGKEQVLRAAETSDPQPERATEWSAASAAAVGRTERASGRRPVRRRTGRKNSAADGALESGLNLPRAAPLPRPLRLLRRPEAISVVSVAPGGPPLRLEERGQWLRIVRWWGPERIETGWQRGRTIRRDYYRVETENGQQYWLFRELEEGGWFWHGSFE